MLTKSVIVLAGGVEEQTLAESLSNILSAIGSLFTTLMSHIKAIAYLFTPVDIVVYESGQSLTVYNTWARANPYAVKLLVADSNGNFIIPGNPLLFIFLCLCIIGLGVTIFKRLANVN